MEKPCQNISPFLVMEILEKAHELEAKGRNIIHLEIGEPDFATPKGIADAAIEAIDRGDTHYTASTGTPELKEAVASHYHKKYGVCVDPAQVLVTRGTSPGLMLALASLISRGDEVILSNPTYACYPNFVRFANANPVFVPVSAEDGFVMDPKDIKGKINPATKAVMINSPSNPTGCLLPKEVMKEIAGLGPIIISDEIYHGLVYGEREHSILEFTDRAFVLNGFSKLYAMTGWRLGYIIAPREFVRPIQKLQQNLFISPNSISQWAGVAALTKEHKEINEMIKTYDERRRYMIPALKELGFKVHHEPRGAFYVLADARKFTHDSLAFAFELLEKTGVAVAPGIDFGTNAEGFLRFSYANSLENIKEACKRLAAYTSSSSCRCS